MKKIFYAFFLVLLLGCTNLSNTPVKKTEDFLKKYQTLDNNVIEDLNETLDSDMTFTTSQKDRYKNIMKKHYQNMTYEIKQDKIDGDKATVLVEINVTDFKKVLDEAEDYVKDNKNEFVTSLGDLDKEKYTDYRLNKLEQAKEKVKFTISINLTKKDNKWNVDKLDKETYDKINGIYDY